MVLDPVEALLSKAKALEKTAKRYREMAEEARKMSRAEGVIDGQLAFIPDGWTVADHLQRLMEDGKKSFKRGELERILVEQKMAGEAGSPDNVRLRSARTAITAGKAKGYLVELEDGNGDPAQNTIQWVPGVYLNPRVQK